MGTDNRSPADRLADRAIAEARRQAKVTAKLVEIARHFLHNYDAETYDGTMSDLVAELDALEKPL